MGGRFTQDSMAGFAGIGGRFTQESAIMENGSNI
jgi:hypothetical protein